MFGFENETTARNLYNIPEFILTRGRATVPSTAHVQCFSFSWIVGQFIQKNIYFHGLKSYILDQSIQKCATCIDPGKTTVPQTAHVDSCMQLVRMC